MHSDFCFAWHGDKQPHVQHKQRRKQNGAKFSIAKYNSKPRYETANPDMDMLTQKLQNSAVNSNKPEQSF